MEGDKRGKGTGGKREEGRGKENLENKSSYVFLAFSYKYVLRGTRDTY